VTLDVAYLCQPARGELVSGDTVVVRDHDGTAMVAVIDVLGHGAEAARVAEVASRFLATASLDGAAALIGSLHQALRGSRGAAAAICVIRERSFEACSVGNVEVRVLGTPMPVIATPGIVGQRFANLRTCTGALASGDRLVCFSDGISSRFALDTIRTLTPRDACAQVMATHRRAHDDATILVADV